MAMAAKENHVLVGRLKRRADFLRVAALRRKWACPGLILQAAPSVAPPAPASPAAGPSLPEAGPPENGLPENGLNVGFTCSKKVGNSVARNRARRRLRAAAAEILPRFAAPGLDYVLIGRQETLHRPFALLLQDLQTALKRVGAFRDGGVAVPPVKQSGPGQEVP